MWWETEIPNGALPIGYKKLVKMFSIDGIEHFRSTYVSPKWEKRILHFEDQNLTVHILPSSYNLPEDPFEHLEFALKNEGFNPYILKKVLTRIASSDMVVYIQSKPNGKYARILWYLYEEFNRAKLPLPDLKQGGYVSILDPQEYYTGISEKKPRHRITNNLLGTLNFAPMVRKTAVLKQFDAKKTKEIVQDLTNHYDPALLSRALTYLYTKETMSSWEIEREKPDQAKLAKFVGLLHKADSIGPLSESVLVDLQKNIVDSRFALDSYRDFQNYVGEEPRLGHLIVHYISPKPENVKELMDGLIQSFHVMEQSSIDPVVAAAALAFSFVFIHPFEDGNGRIHRFLIHYTLSKLKYSPEGIVFPISAAIVRNMHLYDKALETFSRPLKELITHYKVNDNGEMTVLQDTIDFYRFIDLTSIVEYLYGCVERTVLIDFQEELAFLANYDLIKQQCKDVIDMPDQKIDLLIRCVRQNGGKVALRKRESHFSMLTDDEIQKLEKIVSQNAL